jgi:hypothetical protein
MAEPDEDPNLEFLRELGSQMHKHSEVRRLVMHAMAAAVELVNSEKTNRDKAIYLGRVVESVSNEIMGL